MDAAMQALGDLAAGVALAEPSEDLGFARRKRLYGLVQQAIGW
jgi:hypothetical protein